MPRLANFSWRGSMYHNARVIFCTELSPMDLTLSSPSYIHLVELLCKFNKRNNFNKRNQFDTAIIEQYAESEGMGGGGGRETGRERKQKGI